MGFSDMKIIGIIPSRYASSRFPGKPLVMINGLSMVNRVYNQVSKACCLNEIIVATDDQRIYEHVITFGGKVMMTSPYHKSGTERCNEIVQNLRNQNIHFDIAINIQGDEPMIDPLQIDKIAGCFSTPEIEIASLIKKVDQQEDLFNPNTVKVVFDQNLYALYFSRSPIPYFRGKDQKVWAEQGIYFKHIGIYAYRTGILPKLALAGHSVLEETESLEQLKWLQYGFKIKLEITESENIDVNTPGDLSKIINKI